MWYGSTDFLSVMFVSLIFLFNTSSNFNLNYIIIMKIFKQCNNNIITINKNYNFMLYRLHLFYFIYLEGWHMLAVS